jgi:hypothetical protein
MSNYDKIKAVIEYTSYPSIAIQAKHPEDGDDDDARLFLPYLLGKSHKKPSGEKYAVLVYQYAGYRTSSDDEKKWRCFKVDELEEVDQVVFELPEPPPIVSIPDPLTADQLKWQNCVDIPGGRIVRTAKYKPQTR